MEWQDAAISILVVCDGNVCRSPAAQYELQRRIPGARVLSAGAHGPAGASLCESVAAAIAADHGVPLDAPTDFARNFRSRRLSEVDVEDFDIALAATTLIRAALARDHPASRDRFFTILEAADLLAEIALDEPRASPVTPTGLAALMDNHRGAPPAVSRLPSRLRITVADRLDIPDAHGGRSKAHRAVIELARRSAAAIGDSLARLDLN
jgi:protein-tyrosine-phosphatase